VFEVREGLVDEVTEDLKKIMESPLEGKETLGVPLKVEAHAGDNWGEME
jgi:DNA polymerase I-like protein with 3'-5' exonuclease and polymerase domains